MAKFSKLAQRVGGKGPDAWAIHNRAVAMRNAGEDVIILSVGDPDPDTPKPIIDTACESLRRGRTHYAPIQGEPELLEALAKRTSDRWGVEVGAVAL